MTDKERIKRLRVVNKRLLRDLCDALRRLEALESKPKQSTR